MTQRRRPLHAVIHAIRVAYPTLQIPYEGHWKCNDVAMQHLPTVKLNGDNNFVNYKTNENEFDDPYTKITSDSRLFSNYKKNILFNVNSLNRLHKKFNLDNHDFVCLCTRTATKQVDRNVTIKKATKYNEKNQQKSHIGNTGFGRGRNKTYLTCFIFTFKQLFLIIIFLMSFLTITTTTTTQIVKQVNSNEIIKQLEATTIPTPITKSTIATEKFNDFSDSNDNNNDDNKTKTNSNANKIKIIQEMAFKNTLHFTIPTRLPKFQYIYEEMLENSYFENGTTLTKIETKRKNSKTKRAINKNSQFLFSRNISNSFRNKSIKSKNSKRRKITKSQHYQEPNNNADSLIVLSKAKNASVDQYFDFDDGAFEIDDSRLQKSISTLITPNARGTHRRMIDNSSINKNNNNENTIDTKKLARLIMEGLGLKKFPDMRKVNISQEEYISKYVEYFQRLQKRNLRETESSMVTPLPNTELHLLSIVMNSSVDITFQRRKRSTHISSQIFDHSRRQRHSNSRRDDDKINILLQFPLNTDAAHISSDRVEEANIRLMLMYNPALATKSRNGALRKNKNKNQGRSEYIEAITNKKHDFHREFCNYNSSTSERDVKRNVSKVMKQNHILNLKVFFMISGGKRELLDRRSIEFEDGEIADASQSQWLEFDVTRAVKATLNKQSSDQTATKIVGLEVQCDNCKRVGARILNDVSISPNKKNNHRDDRFQLLPVLNIIGRGGEQSQLLHTTNEHTNVPNAYQHNGHINKRKSKNCYKPHQRCCRHNLDVVFKEIKGFEFIIQPKVFDAGYCQGRCPPRHNPAHHHALLQSLIWKQDHRAAPRPCCVPSKLLELEVLHVDEKDSEKLKISTWSEMQVVECSCS